MSTGSKNFGGRPVKDSELADRIAALERDAYVRGKDVVIGRPDAINPNSRAPRLILVAPVSGRHYQLVVDDAGTLSTVLL